MNIRFRAAGVCLFLCSVLASAQTATFVVTGAPVPASMLEHSYGKLPKSIAGYDLSICNVTASKQSIVSSEIFQALSQSAPGLQPIGRQIMLAEILRAQNHSVSAVMNVVLNSVTGVLSILSSAKYGTPSGLVTGAGLGSFSVQQVLTALKPVLSADQLERFEGNVLEEALVLDGGSCVERTVFTVARSAPANPQSLSFHVR